MMIHVDGFHRAFRDATHCLVSIRELRHLFEPSYLSDDEMDPSQRHKWLAHFVEALVLSHGHAKESWGLLRKEFAEAANSEIVLCGIKAESLHAAVVALGTRMLGYVHEFWDRNANIPVLLPETMYGLASAFRPVDPDELWQHSRLEQEYLKARTGRPRGRGPRTRREFAADLLSELRPFRVESLPSAPVEPMDYSSSDQPPPVYFDRKPKSLDEEWLWRVFKPFRSCRVDRAVGERFNAAAVRAQETRRALDAVSERPSSLVPPERLASAAAAHQAAVRELFESLLETVLAAETKEMEVPLATVDPGGEHSGIYYGPNPTSWSEEHGGGPGRIGFPLGTGWSWGKNLLPEAPEDDLRQAHHNVLQLAVSLPRSDLVEGFYLSSWDTDKSEMHDPARIARLIENLGYAYWRAKYRMAVVGSEFANSATTPALLCPSCPEAVADSATRRWSA